MFLAGQGPLALSHSCPVHQVCRLAGRRVRRFSRNDPWLKHGHASKSVAQSPCRPQQKPPPRLCAVWHESRKALLEHAYKGAPGTYFFGGTANPIAAVFCVCMKTLSTSQGRATRHHSSAFISSGCISSHRLRFFPFPPLWSVRRIFPASRCISRVHDRRNISPRRPPVKYRVNNIIRSCPFVCCNTFTTSLSGGT